MPGMTWHALLFVSILPLAAPQASFSQTRFDIPADLPSEDPAVLAQGDGKHEELTLEQTPPPSPAPAPSPAPSPAHSPAPPLAPFPTLPTLPPTPSQELQQQQQAAAYYAQQQTYQQQYAAYYQQYYQQRGYNPYPYYQYYQHGNQQSPYGNRQFQYGNELQAAQTQPTFPQPQPAQPRPLPQALPRITRHSHHQRNTRRDRAAVAAARPLVLQAPHRFENDQLIDAADPQPNDHYTWFSERFDTSGCRASLASIERLFRNKFPSNLAKTGKDVALASIVAERIYECESKEKAGHWRKVDELIAKVQLSKSEEVECRGGMVQEQISCQNLLSFACQFIQPSYQFRLLPARLTVHEARHAEDGADKCRKVVKLVKKRLEG